MVYYTRRGFIRYRKTGLSSHDIVGLLIALSVITSILHVSGVLNKLTAPCETPQNKRTATFTHEKVYSIKSACPMKTGVSQNKCWIVHYANKYDINKETALAIAFAESSYRSNAVNYNTNGSTDKGIFQINSIHRVPDSCRLDVHCNIQWAMEKMKTAGTTPWYSSKHNWYVPSSK